MIHLTNEHVCGHHKDLNNFTVSMSRKMCIYAIVAGSCGCSHAGSLFYVRKTHPGGVSRQSCFVDTL